ncbi:MAG TPA: cell division FtsA domain-containing protein, partial [Hyphomicrobiales bacterium]|nr:cell division FtsA domain-containing protein [Hyphomicrobiales bacterium]
GEQLTDEIASAFGLSKSGAERLKIRHGGIFNGLQADIDLPAANGYTGEKISKFRFNRLVRSAASTLFDAINRRLKGAGYSIPVGGIVLTGGASSLPGLTELASHVLEGEARTARPALLDGLNPDSAMSALVGACLYASRHQSEAEMLSAMGRASEDSSYASRIGQWLRASF